MKKVLVTVSILALAALTACQGESNAPADTAATDTADSRAATTTAPVKPSFDCAKAESEAEKMVCADTQLAQLDNEVARLFKLAEKDSNLTSATKAELLATQRGWIKGRDDCWKDDDKKNCVVDSYAMRIMDLRTGNANARSDDANGITTGPVAFNCEGMDAGIGAIFIRAEPAIAYLAWLDRGVTLVAKETGSGAKYGGKSFDGEYELWTKGNEATFTVPGKPEFKCVQEEIG